MRTALLLLIVVCALAACRTTLQGDGPAPDPEAPWDPDAGTEIDVLPPDVTPAPSPPATPTGEAEKPRFVPTNLPGTARIQLRTQGLRFAARGDLKYQAYLLAVDGKARRIRGKSFSIPAGRHLIRVRWTNHQIPEDAPINETGDSDFYEFLQDGVSEVVIDAKAGRFYEITWPKWDKPGGPTGFEDVTKPLRRR